ncbi:VWA domain-containing protein [Schinkia azotoformans]|uniref:von Willebrand factor type A n=1 Tax=Schinkia azotoformans LMG 9581 TaxID=1131731 RepID=K6CXQ2_SCHAZ|nr:VWA domain-containing protein [Schinkia azotoformans]EKN64987.1 von Willebrand factor type A [Schinkia azotoformans LMG 9581]MEC1640237.1 VWA domain-containing protein [Schinkia azotoformans]MEC1945586.1 VWA domain-containing protein [Schinkia azotoformans]
MKGKKDFSLLLINFNILLIALLVLGQVWYPLTADAATSSASLDVKVEPTKPEGYLIDLNTGVVTAEINTGILPQGVLDSETRVTPMDVIFMVDVSLSMSGTFDHEWKNGWLFHVVNKLEGAQRASNNLINQLKETTIDGDRFAMISFHNGLQEVQPFNTSNQNKNAINTHLDSINNRIQGLKVSTKWSNFQAALDKANTMFGDSKNVKYIIFFTDGLPNAGVQTVQRNIDGMYEPKWCINCKKEYVKQDYTTITNHLLGHSPFLHRSEFWYNGKEYKYSYKYNVYDLAAFDAVSSLASKNIKLYSIGLGKWMDFDKEILSEFSKATGANSYNPQTLDQLTSKLSHISETINEAAMKEIQLKINLKDVSTPDGGHIGIPDDSSATETKDGHYALVSIPDIKYKAGEGTPSELNKLFTMEFDKAGEYTFHDVKLTYTDLAGRKQSIDAPFTIKVIDNESFGLKFKNPPYAINVYKNPSNLTLDLNSEVEVVPPVGLEIEEIEMPTDFTWTSSNEKIAVVNEGIVTAKGVGTTKITVEAKDKKGNIVKAETLVKVNLEGISFGKTIYEYTPGSTKNMFNELKVKPNGFNISPDVLTWTVTGENSIITVDDFGNIEQRGLVSGFVVLTAELKDEYKIDGDPVTPHDKATTLIKINKTDNAIGGPLQEW